MDPGPSGAFLHLPTLKKQKHLMYAWPRAGRWRQGLFSSFQCSGEMETYPNRGMDGSVKGGTEEKHTVLWGD